MYIKIPQGVCLVYERDRIEKQSRISNVSAKKKKSDPTISLDHHKIQKQSSHPPISKAEGQI